MTLVLEIEHLLGLAFAAQSPASALPDWPPRPDRVFSALVAAWGARGEQDGERRALEWLEALSPPEIVASDGWPRSAPTVFVQPNDPEIRRVADPAVFPALRRRQPRRFPAYRPDDPVAQLVWPDIEAEPAILAALNALAADTPYVGHSASLTRCHFGAQAMSRPGRPSRSRVYRGRLAELERLYRAGERPNLRESARPITGAEDHVPASDFSVRWLALEHAGGEMPDLRAAAIVSRALRKAIMSGYRGGPVPAEVSGHMADGSPTDRPHLAIAPLAFFGSRHASGSVLGFALIPPRRGDLLADPNFQRVLREVMPWRGDPDSGRRELQLSADGLCLILMPAGESPLRSLDPDPYTNKAQVWATCTPIVLDRHLKETGNAAREAEIEGLVRRACENIGLPAPERVAAGKHSAWEGAPSAYPSGRAPDWTRWRLPPSLASRQLTHAVIEWARPVRGPVILGAGRFAGLGLCRALGNGGRRQ